MFASIYSMSVAIHFIIIISRRSAECHNNTPRSRVLLMIDRVAPQYYYNIITDPQLTARVLPSVLPFDMLTPPSLFGAPRSFV